MIVSSTWDPLVVTEVFLSSAELCGSVYHWEDMSLDVWMTSYHICCIPDFCCTYIISNDNDINSNSNHNDKELSGDADDADADAAV